MTPEQIRAWREARGLSQAGLADALSVDGTLTQAAVSRWETDGPNGRPPPPYLRLALERLAARIRPKR